MREAVWGKCECKPSESPVRSSQCEIILDRSDRYKGRHTGESAI